MPTEQKPPRVEFLNDSLPTLFVDNIHLYTRNDGMSLLRFMSDLPEGRKEQARLMVTRDKLHALIDDMCRTLEYYPKKNSDTK